MRGRKGPGVGLFEGDVASQSEGPGAELIPGKEQCPPPWLVRLSVTKHLPAHRKRWGAVNTGRVPAQGFHGGRRGLPGCLSVCARLFPGASLTGACGSHSAVLTFTYAPVLRAMGSFFGS